jgi:uncharacterized membrane protein
VKKKAAVTVWRSRDEVQTRWTSYAPENAPDGTVWFAAAPGGAGTEVYLEVEQHPIVGAALKTIGEEPHQQAKDALRRFKQIVETGEIIRSEASPEGETHRRIFPRQRPAQPLEHAGV